MARRVSGRGHWESHSKESLPLLKLPIVVDLPMNRHHYKHPAQLEVSCPAAAVDPENPRSPEREDQLHLKLLQLRASLNHQPSCTRPGDRCRAFHALCRYSE